MGGWVGVEEGGVSACQEGEEGRFGGSSAS